MPDTAYKPPLMQRINLRLILFFSIVALPIGWVVYTFARSEITHGIEDAGNGYTSVDLKAMSLFDFDQNYGQLDDIPKRWRELNGQKVILTGEIVPASATGSELTQFTLCYSVAKCCFSGNPQVQHFVKSTTVKGTVPWYSGLVQVVGTLHVDVKHSDGKIDSIYQMDVDDVKPI